MGLAANLLAERWQIGREGGVKRPLQRGRKEPVDDRPVQNQEKDARVGNRPLHNLALAGRRVGHRAEKQRSREAEKQRSQEAGRIIERESDG